MKKSLSLILMVVSSLACVARATQSVEFRREQLSVKGRMAYDRLRSACIFRVGRVGYSAGTSKEELALYDLLGERRAVEALKSLVSAGSYEGGLYGLLGLSLSKNAEFNRAVEIYKARKERPEWQSTGSFDCFRATAETVTTSSGCVILAESREKVVSDIQSGRFDGLLTAKYLPPRLGRLPIEPGNKKRLQWTIKVPLMP
jgi:hypothetical protein